MCLNSKLVSNPRGVKTVQSLENCKQYSEHQYGCVVLFIGELHRCTELLFYSPVDVTETVVKFISLSPMTHRFNQAQHSGVLKKVK